MRNRAPRESRRLRQAKPQKPIMPWIGTVKGWQDRDEPLTDALVKLLPSELQFHAYALGATGSGKSVFLTALLNQDILLNHSVAVLDRRGNLVQTVLELCSRNVDPNRIVFLDLRETERPLGYNPLAGSGEPFHRAIALVDSIHEESPNWGVTIQEAMTYGFRLLAECGGAMTDLDRLFHDSSFRSQLISVCQENDVRDYWLRHHDLSQENQSKIAGVVMNKLSTLIGPKSLRRILGHKTPVDLQKILSTPGRVILIDLAADQLGSAGVMMGNIFLRSVIREMFSKIDTPERFRTPLRLYVDEFETFSEDQIEIVIAEGRKFKLTTLLAHQCLIQCTPRFRTMVLANVGVKVFFRASREDAQILSKDLTGDPKAIPLHSLPTGEAYVWTRNREATLVEMNAPLVPGSGSLSPYAKAYVGHIRRRNPLYEEATVIEAPSRTDSKKPKASNPSLEEWI